MESNYALLIRKIDEFIRKYYKNQLIRGVLYSLALLGTYYIMIVLLEFFAWFGTTTRSVLFYSFLISTAIVLGRLVVLPLAKIRKLGNVISHTQAAEIIGKHFSEVQDQLLNVLQLHAMNRESDTSSELIAASIEQKTKKIQPVPFVEAIDLKKNRQYLRYALPPLVFIVCGLVIYPSFIVAPSKRLIRHNEVFERPAPFSIAVLNDKLQAVQQDDYTLNVKVIGDKIPAQLFVEIEKTNYKMERESNSLYHFVFKNIQRNTPFVINAEEYNSKEYVLKVLPKPTILSFDVEAEYPAYLHRKNETFVNTGDLNIPIGSKLTWKFYTRDTKAIMFRMGGKLNELKADKSNTFVQSERMMVGSPYSISSRNEFFLSKDSLAYLINVIPDLYPSITVEEIKDSVFDNRFYFQGNVKDDYGLSKLVFAWKTKKTGEESSSTGNLKTKEIVIDKSKLE